MKTAQALKLVVIGTAAIMGGLVVWRTYRLAQAAGQGLSNLPGQMGDALKDVGALVKEQAAIAAESARQVYQNTVGVAVDSVSSAAREVAIGTGLYTPPDYVNEIPLSQWDGGLRAWVRSIKTLRKIKVQNVDADFIGWKYYSNGTLISPAGEYFLRNTEAVPESLASTTAAFSEAWYNGAPVWDVSKVLEQWQTQ